MLYCADCCSCGSINFRVSGCNSTLKGGIAISLYAGSLAGSLVGSATSDSSGNASIAIPSSGTYAYSGVPTAGAYFSSTPITGTVTVASCPISPSNLTGFVLVPASGYKCECGACIDPLPSVFSLTDVNTTLSLNSPTTGGVTQNNWGTPQYTTGSHYHVDYALQCPFTTVGTNGSSGLSNLFKLTQTVSDFINGGGTIKTSTVAAGNPGACNSVFPLTFSIAGSMAGVADGTVTVS